MAGGGRMIRSLNRKGKTLLRRRLMRLRLRLGLRREWIGSGERDAADLLLFECESAAYEGGRLERPGIGDRNRGARDDRRIRWKGLGRNWLWSGALNWRCERGIANGWGRGSHRSSSSGDRTSDDRRSYSRCR